MKIDRYRCVRNEGSTFNGMIAMIIQNHAPTSPLDRLEQEALFILNETFANFSNPKLSFSAGKDSICIAYLASKLFSSFIEENAFPFELFHYDSGDNFPEVLEFRDQFRSDICANLKVFRIADSSTTTSGKVEGIIELIHASIGEYGVDGLICGGRRDEENSRAKERIFSIRGSDGVWNLHEQHPEPWQNYNLSLHAGEHMRVFPLSNWTELDVWRYLEREEVQLPDVYFAQERDVFLRGGALLAYHPDIELRDDEVVQTRLVRCRTVGDRGTTGFVESSARTVSQIVQELEVARFSERSGRSEDAHSQTGMESRKIDGWF